MEMNLIITVGRQEGSGGSEVGRKLAQSLGAAYYDKNLLAIAAKESGLCEDVFEKADEKAVSGLSFTQVIDWACPAGLFSPYGNVLSSDALFQLQSDTINRLADKGPCVLMGRCADYVLRNHPNRRSLFIHNTAQNRIRNLCQTHGITPEAAAERIVKSDKGRAAYYNYYTNKIWGQAVSYHLSVDVSMLGIDPSVEFILQWLKQSSRTTIG